MVRRSVPYVHRSFFTFVDQYSTLVNKFNSVTSFVDTVDPGGGGVSGRRFSGLDIFAGSFVIKFL